VSSQSFLYHHENKRFLLISRCQECGYIAEENILVSEVGFAEGAGGRVHVQGAFVSHGSSMSTISEETWVGLMSSWYRWTTRSE
jgi:hypothetical protein